MGHGDFQNADEQPPLGALAPHDEVYPGVIFGRPEWIFSPSYWAAIVANKPVDAALFRQPSCLVEEVGFCLLGGFGIKAEMNCAAFTALKKRGVFRGGWEASEIEEILRLPFALAGRQVRYRFPRQRAERLAGAIQRLRCEHVPLSSAEALRNYLLTYTGIGPKTASWITRNWLDSDEVAIIDIHVERAGRVMGIFDDQQSLPRDYFEMERRFLALASSLKVRASVLDIAIWSEMRKAGMPLNGLPTFKEPTNGKRRRRGKHGGNVQEAEAV